MSCQIGKTALMAAAGAGHLELVELLLAVGAVVDAGHQVGAWWCVSCVRSHVQHTGWQNSAHVCGCIWSIRCDPNTAECRGECGRGGSGAAWRCRRCAVPSSSHPAYLFLVPVSSSCVDATQSGLTVVMIAAAKGHVEVLNLLVSHPGVGLDMACTTVRASLCLCACVSYPSSGCGRGTRRSCGGRSVDMQRW